MENKIILIEINQPIGTFYIGKLNSRELLKITEIKRREDSSGVQRELNTARLSGITKFCEDPDATFPTPIIMAIKSSMISKLECLDTKNGIYSMVFNTDTISCEVLDGQHRLEGIRRAENFETELPIVMMFDLEEEEKAYIFSTINSNQAKVDKSLIYDLFDLSKKRSPQRTCHEIARILNSDEESPFYKRLKMLGKKKTENASLSQGTFINYLMRLISKNPQNDMVEIKRAKKLAPDTSLIFRDYFIKDTDEIILRIMKNYFNSIRKSFADEWNNPDKYILTKTTGYGAFMKVLPILYKKGIEEGKLSEEFFSDYWIILKERLNSDKKELNSKDFLSGEQGQNEMANYILTALNLSTKS